jgi:hypothetical protein
MDKKSILFNIVGSIKCFKISTEPSITGRSNPRASGFVFAIISREIIARRQTILLKIGWKTKKNDNYFIVIDIFLNIFLFKSLWKCAILLLER